MQNLHDDKHLDDLSRQAADEYQPDQDLHSWESLRPGLEAALPQKKERKRRFLVVFLLFLLIGGGVVFSTVWNKPQQTGNNKLVQKPAVAEKPAASKNIPAKDASSRPEQTTAATPATQQKTSPSKSNETSSSVNDPTAQSNKTITAPVQIAEVINKKAINKNKTGRATRSNTPDNTKMNNGIAKKVDNSATKKPVTTEKYATTEPVTENRNTVTPAISVAEEKKINAANISADITKLIIEKYWQENPAPLKAIPETITKKDQNKKASPLKNRWEFGAVYAPDVSTVRFTHTQKPGTNTGLTIAYNLSKRFAIQTGAIYTTKNYKIYGKDYHPPKGYWTDYVNLETVMGECNMWDIPLNLRYNLAPRKSANLFASAGLSSYLMQKEDYDFFYYYNGNPVNRYRTYDSDSKHWFGVLNLSVAYERQVGRNISLQAEPFFKQPLTGVGFGSVKLNTTGIYFSVKYKPLTAAGKPVKALR